jgi:hypothetical protein
MAKDEYPETILEWGSDGPRGGGRYTVSVRKNTGEISIDVKSPFGGSTHYFARQMARRMAAAILTATEKK